ncbi:MAG: hypothetical protein ACR2F1_15055, partial [Nitrososphaeraceae archaeon]
LIPDKNLHINMKLIQKEVIGILLLCQRCKHEWKYKGTNPYITTCPYCRTTVTVNRKRNLQKVMR